MTGMFFFIGVEVWDKGGVVLFIGVQVGVRVEWFFDLGFQGA